MVLGLIVSALGGRAQAQPAAGAAAPQPLLRLEADGPASRVTALAFSPDGRTLYATGFDKVVRAWELDPTGTRFTPTAWVYRVPIGPGNVGVLNALAVSPDGAWLAVAGHGATRVGARPAEAGRVYPYEPAPTSDMLEDHALIYLFHTTTHALKVLRGHHGDVYQLAFAPAQAGKTPLLVSAAIEPASPPQQGKVGRVRLWDVNQAQSLDANGNLVGQGGWLAELPIVANPSQLVGLAVRHTGGQPTEVQVAITWSTSTWSGGKLRLWNPAQQGPERLIEAADEANAFRNDAVADSPDLGLITVGIGEGGYVKHWRNGVEQKPTPHALTPPPGSLALLPQALGLAASQADGRSDRLAVVARVVDQQRRLQSTRLRLLTLPAGEPVGDVELWSAGGPSVLATSPRGRYLAVAGAADHTIRIYAVADLDKNPEPTQKLAGAGVTFRDLGFLQKKQGDDVGLWLSPAARPERTEPPTLQPEDLVFDFTGRRLTSNPANQGWENSDPRQDGWRVLPPQSLPPARDGTAGLRRFKWQGPQTSGQVDIHLLMREELSTYVLVPPSRMRAEPILAVATWEVGAAKTNLALYRTEMNHAGEPVRLLGAHTQRIHALAASRDGRLLASAGDDEMVCIWTLTDLDQILERQGTLWGVYIQQSGKELRVAKVESWSSAAGKLEVNDRLQGQILPRGLTPFATALDYYNALWDLRPGNKVKLRVLRDGNPQDVELDVGQGVDDRRPLLSLFVTPGPNDTWQWIAWTPIGPYDSSGRAVERYLGWHFNPRRLEEPVRFAEAGEYRKKLYKPGLLKALLVHADVHQALADVPLPPVPRPSLDVQLASFGTGPLDPDKGQYLVRYPLAHLALSIAGPSIAEEEVESVSWQWLDPPGPRQLFGLDTALGQRITKTVDLPTAPGIYRLALRVRTREAVPQEEEKVITLRYQPPGPIITFEKEWLTHELGDGVVHKAEFPLLARINRVSNLPTVAASSVGLLSSSMAPELASAFGALVPGLNAESHRPDVTVTVQVNRDPPREVGQDVKLRIPLRPGENRLHIRAVNTHALAGYEESESDQHTLVVHFQKEEAPHLSLKTLEALPPAAGSQPVVLGQINVVHAPRMRLHGEICAKTPPKPIQLLDRQEKLLAIVEPDQQGHFVQELVLEPGVAREWRLRAKTPNSDATIVSVQIQYQPQTPQFEWREPTEDLHLARGRNEPEVVLKGRLRMPSVPEPFEMIVTVLNRARPVIQDGARERIRLVYERAQLDTLLRGDPAPAVEQRLRLGAGENTIRVELCNAWHRQPVETQSRRVFYLRPPRLLTMECSPPGKSPYTDVVARVQSPTPLLRVECNRQEYPVTAQAVGQQDEETIWEVRVPKVGLDEGPNKIQFTARNADGDPPAPLTKLVELPPRGAPPQVRLERLSDGESEPFCYVAYRIESESPLEQVQLFRGLKHVRDLDLAGSKGLIQDTLRLELDPGPNDYRLVAVNAGGKRQDRVWIIHVDTPVSIHIAAASKVEKVEEPRMELLGYVAFKDKNRAAEIAGKIGTIRVYVNDFLQPPPRPTPSGGEANRINFSTTIVLNQPLNKIEVTCPELIKEAGSTPTHIVACDHPSRPANLHVMIVGIGIPNPRTLAARALRALQAAPAKDGMGSSAVDHVTLHSRSSVFDHVTLHGVASDYVSKGKIESMLNRVQMEIMPSGKPSPNEVFLIYWLGDDARADQGGLYLPTSETHVAEQERPLSETAVPLQKILGTSEDVLGARVLFLDLGTGAARGRQTTLDLFHVHAAVMRHRFAPGEPPPLLLQALEDMARQRKPGEPISLKDFRSEARAYFGRFKGSELFDNLTAIALAELVIRR
jgi:WD40 repeat protein